MIFRHTNDNGVRFSKLICFSHNFRQIGSVGKHPLFVA